MDLKVIYDGTLMKCVKEIKIYILKGYLYKLTEKERKNLIGEKSWKGQYYTIQKKDIIEFYKSNDWDACFFKLKGGTEFRIDCANPLSFFKEENFKLIKLFGNSYDKRYLEFIEKYPKYK